MHACMHACIHTYTYVYSSALEMVRAGLHWSFRIIVVIIIIGCFCSFVCVTVVCYLSFLFNDNDMCICM